MIELLVGVLLAAAAVGLVLFPIFRPEVGGRGTGDGGRVDLEEGEDFEDDMSPRAVALRALREIEFDRATGKLSDEDYETLHGRYEAEALAALRAENAGSGMREAGSGTAGPTLPASRFPLPECPTHGPRPEPDAVFCSECGRRLGSSPGYCARCGTSLEFGARYCSGCGARVAA